MSALTPSQEAVMALHERGKPTDAIAAQLGMSQTRVSRIISTYDADPIHDEARERRIRRGSQRLLWHVRKAGGHR